MILRYSARGAIGFGLGELLLVVAIGKCSTLGPVSGDTLSIVGAWYGRPTAVQQAVRKAQFLQDGTYIFTGSDGSGVRGRYTMDGRREAQLTGDSVWTSAFLKEKNELHLLDADSGRAQRLEAASPIGQQLRLALPALLAAAAAAIGAGFLTFGAGRFWPGVVGFGIAAMPAAFGVLFTLIGLQGGGAPSYLWGALGIGLPLGLVGAVGGLSIKPSLLLPGAFIFGGAGAAGGIAAFYIVTAQTSPALSIAALMAPFLSAGALFGAVFGFLEN